MVSDSLTLISKGRAGFVTAADNRKFYGERSKYDWFGSRVPVMTAGSSRSSVYAVRYLPMDFLVR